MDFYLSSYKIGGEKEVQQLKDLIPPNKRTAYISNSLDFSDDTERRKQSEQADFFELNAIGLEVEDFDLRKYFDQPEKLEEDLRQYGVIWVRGGNVFVLRQAMKLSGFDLVLQNLVRRGVNILYGGYSAGVCVLAPSLRGLELVDDITKQPYSQQKELIWEGLNLINFAIVPHYKSNHPETELVNRVVEQYEKNGTPFRTLSDGEVIIIRNLVSPRG
jgi:dipeptidase E